MLSNKTREAVMEKFGIDVGIHHEEGGDNMIDFTKDTEEQNEYIEQLSKMSFTKEYTMEDLDDNIYRFTGLKLLTKDEPSLLKGETVYLCNYSINTSLKLPFLLFNLYRYDDDTIGFPQVINEGAPMIERLKENINTVYKSWNVTVEYHGYIRYNDAIYMWYSNTYNESQTPEIMQGTREDKWWSVMVSEVVNQRKVLNFPIQYDVTQFFLSNIALLFLENKEGKTVETPQVQYYGNYYKRIAYTAAIGHERELPGAGMGPYYYFGTYLRALRYALWTSQRKPMSIHDKLITISEDGLFSRGGLVRFAIFTGKHTMLLGRETDEKDDAGDNTDYKVKRARLRDEEGKWVNEYDSIGQGIYEIDGKIYQPQLAVKTFQQQLPLSYYYIDTRQVLEGISLENIIIE